MATEQTRARFELERALFTALSSAPELLGNLGSATADEPLLGQDVSGRVLVTAIGTEIHVWRRRARLERVASFSLRERATCVASSADGRAIAAMGRRWLRVWRFDGDTLAPAFETDLVSTAFTGFSCSAAAFAKAGSLILGGSDGTVLRADAQGSISTLLAEPLGGEITGLGVDAREGRAYAGVLRSDRSLVAIDFASGSATALSGGPRMPPRSLALSDDGALLASGHEDGTVTIWSTGAQTIRHSFGRSTGPRTGCKPEDADRASRAAVTAIRFLPGASEASVRLLAGDEDGYVRRLDVASGCLDARQVGPRNISPISGIAALDDENLIVSAAFASPLRLIDGSHPNAHALETVVATRLPARELAVTADQQRILTTDGSSLTALPIAGGPRQRKELPTGWDALALSGDGLEVACATAYGVEPAAVAVLRADEPSAPPRVLEGFRPSLPRMALSRTGHWLAAGNFARPAGAALWHVARSNRPRPLRDVQGPVSVLTFSSNEAHLAIVELDGRVTVRRTSDGGMEFDERIPSASIVALNSDSSRAAVGESPVGKITLLHPLSKNAERIELRGHRKGVAALAFDEAGRLLLSSDVEGSMIVWDVAARDQIGAARIGDGSFVRSIAFGSPGLATTLTQGGTRSSLWSVDPDRWAQRALLAASSFPR